MSSTAVGWLSGPRWAKPTNAGTSRRMGWGPAGRVAMQATPGSRPW